ncbi:MULTISPECIES: MarR family winged helix-turn-helix transcriptional regulator [unclassified Pseudoxanthomonas]|uniref:MarR family winged helix-turn-helix transcriptional regulator n=1 Tax=unclassified Pseudoxanthomonas TaxID=2645906 RepID=UPI001619945B|nr:MULTISPECIES: MarR family winged helix-turn-helix transcriptional regulator [unclassified Pseudoxanthomonas]MBB3277413.1 DNA-binding MarR family transcriptional regulator [Pseudoxanthomonas sp. OG2]MBV7474086.1 MarR family winged helix-turn-helix transcriptional regulator [Pseudoxanthomonas sp. PXM05]
MPTKKPVRELHGSWMAFSFAAQLESRYEKLMNRALRKKRIGISLREWQAISYIASTRPEEMYVTGRWLPTRSGVMRALDIDKAAASRLVGGLVRKGHLAELPAKGFDMRMKVLVPGMKGRLLIKPVLKLEDEVMARLLASMGGHAAKDAKIALEKLKGAFVRVDALRWDGVIGDDQT